jgi:CheY-like chemotaxis protein
MALWVMLPLCGLGIVLADDDADNAEMLAELLILRGAKVRTARNGLEVLELVSSCTPDALLLDIAMPGIDGYELVSRLRSAPETSSAFILAVTAREMSMDSERSFAAGFDAHILKPIDGDALVDLLSARRLPRAPRD